MILGGVGTAHTAVHGPGLHSTIITIHGGGLRGHSDGMILGTRGAGARHGDGVPHTVGAGEEPGTPATIRPTPAVGTTDGPERGTRRLLRPEQAVLISG